MKGWEHVTERDLADRVKRLRADIAAVTLRRPSFTLEGNVLGFLLPRKLKSPNETLWKHWRLKMRETRGWEADIQLAWGRPSVLPTAHKRRIAVTRLVPSRGAFIRDEDNLRFAVKPLNDALKRLGLIFDDSTGWLEQPLTVQAVSDDGHYWTAITIETLPEG